MRIGLLARLMSCLMVGSVSIVLIHTDAAEVFLEATRPDSRIPIWILGFENKISPDRLKSDFENQAMSILKADLRRSQVFSTVDLPSNAITFDGEKCIRPSQVRQALDRGVAALTWGRIGSRNSERGPGLFLDACAYDSGREDFLPGRRYIGRPFGLSLMRRMVHRWADELIYHYSGEQGVAESKIVFVSEHQGGRELYVMDADGYGARQVTADGFLNLMPSWSPDRRFVVYTAHRQRSQAIVKLELASNERETLIDPNSLNITPAFSPDGKTLAYTTSYGGNSEIDQVDLLTKQVRRLTDHPSADLSPTWSPDGRELAFTSDRAGRPQIYLMNADGSNVRRLTFTGEYNAAPAWSPQGDWIAFVCRIPKQGFKLCLITPDGQQQTQITFDPGIDDSPSWAPNGKHLVFSSTRKGRSHIYRIHRDGTGLERLTSGGTHHSSPSWSPFKPVGTRKTAAQEPS